MKNSLTFWLIIVALLAFLIQIVGNVPFDKSDWIFLFLLTGLIVLNIKLNKVIKLLSKK